MPGGMVEAFDFWRDRVLSTYAEKLVLVDAAIADILTNGQDVALEGMRYTRADIEKLERLRRYYESQVNSSSATLFDRALTGVPYRGGC